MSKSSPRSASKDEVTSDPRWAAVIARDPCADDTFFFSVKTTGVYCRPSCGARTPRPENVAFYRTADEAERAGFRPCLRCEPDQRPLAERHAATVAALCRIIDQSAAPLSLDALARRTKMSPWHLLRVFKSVTGVTPKAYAAARRAERVRAALNARGSVTEAILDAGFGSTGRFYETSDAVLGMTPTRYRRGGAGEEIRYAVGRCSLGAVLVAATARGVCAILLGDDPEALARDLAQRFPRASLRAAEEGFAQTVAAVVGLVERPRADLALPLDVRGTAFQRRVWEALRAIPAGSTTTYAALAAQLGAPKSVRAVAQACAANALAVAIPCHRVLRTDGALAGYRWGLSRKRALLDREAPR